MQRLAPALEDVDHLCGSQLARERAPADEFRRGGDVARRIEVADEIRHQLATADGRCRFVSMLPQPLASACGTRLTKRKLIPRRPQAQPS